MVLLRFQGENIINKNVAKEILNQIHIKNFIQSWVNFDWLWKHNTLNF